jgi:hypothetical protein
LHETSKIEKYKLKRNINDKIAPICIIFVNSLKLNKE